MFRFPPRRILVPVDFSEASLRAFRAAKMTADRFGARLEAVYCEPPLPLEMAAYDVELQTRARRRAEAELRRRLPGADAVHVVRGEPARVILRLARERKPDLVIMGTHARKGVMRAEFGSVAEAVIWDCPVPALIVRKGLRFPRRVLAPLREDQDAQRGLVAAGLVARALKGRLDVLHVVTDPLFGAAPEKLLRTRIAQLPAGIRRDTKPTIEVRVGDPIKEILRATRTRDLLVLVARRKSLLGDWVLGTTAQRLVRYSPIPVLTVPTPRHRRPAR